MSTVKINEKVFASNGFAISNGRILRGGLPIDGPDEGFYISPSLLNVTKKISYDNTLVLSNVSQYPKEVSSIKGLLSFARAYAKSKGKSLVVDRNLSQKYNIVNFVAGPEGNESKDSTTYPMTIDELRHASEILKKDFVLKPVENNFTYINGSSLGEGDKGNTSITNRIELNNFVVPDDVGMILNVDKMSRGRLDRKMSINLKSISKDNTYGNDYRNFKIVSNTDGILEIEHKTNEPIISLPKLDENCYSKDLVSFKINVGETGASVLSNKNVFDNLDDKVIPKVHAKAGIEGLNTFFKKLNYDEDFSRKVSSSIKNMKPSDIKYISKLFDNLKNIKQLAKKNPSLFSHDYGDNIVTSSGDIVDVIDKVLRYDTPEMNRCLQILSEERQNRIDILKGNDVKDSSPSLSF